ncbi:MAG: UDP-N-acetylmuramoyl-tripeptide--D-alanyl-D-alanine ligase [Bacteroidetes bacterium]|nr:UDP-N-acetylmuramoyl-tripeptide--D-alanyl-D-alanine ligase [Bacteroidota bacterium]
MSIEEIYAVYLKYPEISTDSRRIAKNCLFFALKGENFDGNQYAESALNQGAAFAITDNESSVINTHYILVKDVLRTLQELASLHRSKLNIPFIAITGTNGKTTTKELINAILSCKFRTIATKGNLNNHIGVPLTILSISRDTEMAIIEMGANHPGEIDFLCSIARPDFGIITNIGKAHLEGFGGFEGVIRTKTELYRFLKNNNGTIFINADNPLLVEHSSGLQKYSYGKEISADFQGILTGSNPFVDFIFNIDNEQVTVHSKIYGKYNFENLLAAAAIGHFFKTDNHMIKNALENYIPSNNRSQISSTGSNRLILDAYNANPGSMTTAIENFSELADPNKVVIIGDMLELGEETEKEHIDIIRLLELKQFIGVYLVGPVFTTLCDRLDWICFQDSDLARLWFEFHRLENSTVLLKGSRGIKLEIIAEVL